MLQLEGVAAGASLLAKSLTRCALSSFPGPPTTRRRPQSGEKASQQLHLPLFVSAAGSEGRGGSGGWVARQRQLLAIQTSMHLSAGVKRPRSPSPSADAAEEGRRRATGQQDGWQAAPERPRDNSELSLRQEKKQDVTLLLEPLDAPSGVAAAHEALPTWPSLSTVMGALRGQKKKASAACSAYRAPVRHPLVNLSSSLLWRSAATSCSAPTK